MFPHMEEPTTTDGVPHMLRELLKPSTDAVALVHPEMPMLGILWIPEQFVLKTSGAQKYTKSQPHIPSLCLLFQNARCNSREACNQIHVEREFAEQLRHLLNSSTISNCCRYHGDLGSSNSTLFAGNERVEVRPGGGVPPIPVPASCLAVTEYWNAAFSWNYLADKHNVLFFPTSRVCNLHQRHTCKYGSACKNVHVCRELWAQIHPSALPAPPPRRMPLAMGAAGRPLLPCGVHPGVIAPTRPGPKRVSRAIPIFDPMSGQEVCVAEPPAVGVGAEASPTATEGSGTTDPSAALCPKADEGRVHNDDHLIFSLEHLDMMTMALNLDGFQNIIPLPLDFESDPRPSHEDTNYKPLVAPVTLSAPCASSGNVSFNSQATRPASPSTSSGTEASYGEESGAGDDDLQKGPTPHAYLAFWGLTPAPYLASAPGL